VPKKQTVKQESPSAKEHWLAVEIGRIAKLFALYLLKDVKDEATKVNRLTAVGFSVKEIAALLNKTELNVRVQISQAKRRRSK
jgi:DNA-binding NarL/FixJ family response regulator